MIAIIIAFAAFLEVVSSPVASEASSTQIDNSQSFLHFSAYHSDEGKLGHTSLVDAHEDWAIGDPEVAEFQAVSKSDGRLEAIPVSPPRYKQGNPKALVDLGMEVNFNDTTSEGQCHPSPAH
ncbi:hypothetical protein C8R41DRAFT_925064 [Lentinula lateritia]|uniref:Uncharacterized protein n=1 Tax=Lentinula lateritia TaxID=40482 RepID=A0ABQ8V614_9AGAR|nr:hypothetical protein C8R41DRAFT_925064 [Lentinula lateritia]